MKLRNIMSVGVEVECGMPEELYYAIYDYSEGATPEGNFLTLARLSDFDSTNVSIDTDGSVDVPRPSGFSGNWMRNAEVRYWSRSPDEVLSFVKMLFDSGIRQNRSCGNHVHFRADKRLISAIMCIEAVQDFVKRYTMRWSLSEKHLDRRFSHYCTTEYLKSRRKFMRELLDARYVAVNFTSLFDEQRTLEIRILPYAENYKEYEVQFKWLVETIDDLMEYWSKRFVVSFGVNVEKLVSVAASEKIEEVIE